jgi:hypothetical protein
MPYEHSIMVQEGNKCQSVSISSTSAQSSTIDKGQAVIYATTDCFMRQGSNPTALSTGVDQFIPGSTLLRITMKPMSKLAFVTTSATGTVYIQPEC